MEVYVNGSDLFLLVCSPMLTWPSRLETDLGRAGQMAVVTLCLCCWDVATRERALVQGLVHSGALWFHLCQRMWLVGISLRRSRNMTIDGCGDQTASVHGKEGVSSS